MEFTEADHQHLVEIKGMLNTLAYLSMEVRRLQDIYYNRGRREHDLAQSKKAEKLLDEYHRILRKRGIGTTPPPKAIQQSLI